MLVTIFECWWWYVDVGDWNLVLVTSFECWCQTLMKQDSGCWWPKWSKPSEMWSVWCIFICANGYNRIVLGGRLNRPWTTIRLFHFYKNMNNFYFPDFLSVCVYFKMKTASSFNQNAQPEWKRVHRDKQHFDNDLHTWQNDH